MLLDAALAPVFERRETRRRSLLKTLTWRVTATADTFAISWIVTGNLVAAGSIAGVEVATKMAIYYLHERAWARVPWGWVTRQVNPHPARPVARAVPRQAPPLEEIAEPVEPHRGAHPGAFQRRADLRQAVGGE